jgi:DNA-binding transcriptional LysR family regulator
MDRVLQMQIFQRVAELGSFSRCAEQLGLPKTTVSEAVQQLEHSLGNRLLNRTTRRVELTSDGQNYYQRCIEVLADFDELQQMFQPQDQQLQGVLRIDMQTNFACDLVIPALPDFFEKHPDLQIQLSSTDRKVDLIAEGFDAIVRVGQLTDSSLIARKLGELAQVNCVSPAYIKRYGEPKNLADLENHYLVNYSQQLSGRKAEFEYMDNGRVAYLPMRSRITVNSVEAYNAACVAGLGIIQIPHATSRALFTSGKFIPILPEYNAPPMPVSLLYANRHLISRRLRVFAQWLEQLMRDYLR